MIWIVSDKENKCKEENSLLKSKQKENSNSQVTSGIKSSLTYLSSEVYIKIQERFQTIC